MPPRLPIPLLPLYRSSNSPVPLFLIPSFSRQIRPASILSSLSENPSSYKTPIKRGRGPSSGKGKTSGRGHKGQRQHGKVPRGFNGGQTPLEVVKGVRGFKNVLSIDLQIVPLSRIQSWIDQARLDPSKPITIRELGLSRCVSSIHDGVKLLANSSDELRSAIHIVVSRASAAAIAAVEKAGGSVTTRFYTRFAVQKILKGRMDPMVSLQSRRSGEVGGEAGAEEGKVAEDGESVGGDVGPVVLAPFRTGFQHRLPDPTSRKDIEYYRDPAHRGYLSHLVMEGQTPSLFFKAPRAEGTKVIRAPGKKRVAVENRLW